MRPPPGTAGHRRHRGHGWRGGDPSAQAANGLRRTLDAGAAPLSERQRSLFTGLVIGGGAAFLLTRFVRAWLYEVSAGDSVTFGLAGAALVAAAAIACYIPTRRALRADIASVIRAE